MKKKLLVFGIFVTALGIASVTEEIHGCMMCPLDGFLFYLGMTSSQAFGFLEEICWHLIVAGALMTLAALALYWKDKTPVLGKIRFRLPKLRSWSRRRVAVHAIVFLLIVVHITLTLRGKTEIKSICPRTLGEMIMKGQFGTSAIFGAFVLLMVLVWGRSLCSWVCVYAPIQEQSANLLRAGSRDPAKKKFKPSIAIWITTGVLWTSLLYHAVRNYRILDFNPYYGDRVASYWVFLGGAVTSIPLTMFFTHLFGTRFFCKFVCPIGGLQSLYSKFSLLKIRISQSKCTHCSGCANACQMGVKIDRYARESSLAIMDRNCILCGDCVDRCPEKALHFGWHPAIGAADMNNAVPCRQSIVRELVHGKSTWPDAPTQRVRRSRGSDHDLRVD